MSKTAEEKPQTTGDEARRDKQFVGPRVRTISKDRHSFEGRYKQHNIYIRREDRNDPWYITVKNDAGEIAYDGWWTVPAQEDRIATLREAIVEACRGSLLWPNTQEETCHEV